MRPAIRLVLSDVDGTLLTTDKTLTDAAVRAVERLGDAGVIFAITSARPPQGLEKFVEPLKLSTPLSAFNGGLIVDSHMKVLRAETIPEDMVAPLVAGMDAHDLSVWVFQGTQWYVRDPNGPHVDSEGRACDCTPTVVDDVGGVTKGVNKVVGVSDLPGATARAAAALSSKFSAQLSAVCSQSYYLDVTTHDANKGRVVTFLADLYDVSADQVATIGDMDNDVSMFAASGLSIAMGNATDEVKAAAREVTRGNDDEGFAHAIEAFVLS